MYYVNFTFFTKIFIKIIEFAFTLVHTLFIMFCELITKLFEIKLFFFSFTFGFNNIIFMNFCSVNFLIQWRMIKIIFPVVFLQHCTSLKFWLEKFQKKAAKYASISTWQSYIVYIFIFEAHFVKAFLKELIRGLFKRSHLRPF